MKLTRTRHSILIRRAMDNAFDAYLEWRERAETVQIAYSTWTAAASEDVAIAFRAYVVALDREENAANRYGALVEQFRNIADPGFAEDDCELRGERGGVSAQR